MPKRIYEITASNAARTLRVEASGSRQAAFAATRAGLDVVYVEETGYRRASGHDVPWIGILTILGVLFVALASVAMGFVGDDPPAPPAAAVNR